jgi:hypothetical protein
MLKNFAKVSINIVVENHKDVKFLKTAYSIRRLPVVANAL